MQADDKKTAQSRNESLRQHDTLCEKLGILSNIRQYVEDFTLRQCGQNGIPVLIVGDAGLFVTYDGRCQMMLTKTPALLDSDDFSVSQEEWAAIWEDDSTEKNWRTIFQSHLLPNIRDPEVFFERYIGIPRLIDAFVAGEQSGMMANSPLLTAPIRWVKTSNPPLVFFFDKQGIYRRLPEQEYLSSIRPDMREKVRPGKQPVWRRYDINTAAWIKASKKFQPGTHIEDCVRIFLQESITFNILDLSDFDRLVQRIKAPAFERNPENQRKNTFDRIRVIVCLGQTVAPSFTELVDKIKLYKTQIDRLVLQKIESSRSFAQYGTLIDDIKASKITLCRDYTLEYIFEPKVHC